ncbi:MAG: membrane protein insertase YidC [Nocardioides sp.]
MHALGQLGHLILAPLYYAVSAVLLAWHWFFSLFMNPNSGGAWVLSIIGLTLVVRAALIPLFVKQIKSSRNMQLIQPKVKELQKKYGHDRERLAQETMALYKETGTNPFSACLPLLVQTPVFIALFRLLDQAYRHGTANGFMTPAQAYSLGHAKLFGTIPISATFLKNDGLVQVQILAAILVVAMTITTFTTQRQLMSKNMPADAMSGQYAQQQKLLLYVLPVVFAVGGIAFPIGVLFYWTTTNLWTMGQQFYVIRRNPAPGTPAFDAKVARDRAKGRTTELSQELAVEEAHGDKRPSSEKPKPRQQPKKQSREKRKKGKKPGQPRPGAPNAGGAASPGGSPTADGAPDDDAENDDTDDQGKSA